MVCSMRAAKSASERFVSNAPDAQYNSASGAYSGGQAGRAWSVHFAEVFGRQRSWIRLGGPAALHHRNRWRAAQAELIAEADGDDLKTSSTGRTLCPVLRV